MKYVVFSPYWNIPPDIAQKEIVPKAEKDPGYLERNNMEVDEAGGRYRQRPGRGNSLGAVKFVFPNHFNVYLHGTPAHALFDRVERDFSHGCVRRRACRWISQNTCFAISPNGPKKRSAPR